MKRTIQILLIIIIIFIFYIFYIFYLKTDINFDTNIRNDENLNLEYLNQSKQNEIKNLIKDLKYEININEVEKYIITADYGHIFVENNNEIIKMNKVKARFVDKNVIKLVITSDEADYNSSNSNTSFRKNVKTKYLTHQISSEAMDFFFDKNEIIIHKNVEYIGIYGKLISDNIKINLYTKKIDIYMDHQNARVEIQNIR